MGSRFDPSKAPFASRDDVEDLETRNDAQFVGDSTPEEASLDEQLAHAPASDNGMTIENTLNPGMAAPQGSAAEFVEAHDPAAADASTTQEQPAGAAANVTGDELLRLQDENAQLRQFAEQVQHENDQLMSQWEQGQKESNQVKQYLDQARRRLEQMEKAAEVGQNRERNLESLVEEKSELINQLEARVGELEKLGAGKANQGVLSEEELLEIQRQLEEERLQIQQERQDMEEEFKKVELTMSRERAEVARQRKEIDTKKRDVEMLIETALRDERLKHQMGAILNLQSEMKGKATGQSAIRPGMGRAPAPQSGAGYVPPAANEGYGVPQSPPAGTPYSGRGFVPPAPSTLQQQLPVDPTQLAQQPGQNQTPQTPKPGGSILRRLFKGGQQ